MQHAFTCITAYVQFELRAITHATNDPRDTDACGNIECKAEGWETSIARGTECSSVTLLMPLQHRAWTQLGEAHLC